MKNRLITIFLVLILIGIILLLGNFVLNKNSVPTAIEKMTVLPKSFSQNSKPTLTPTPTPITFNFDKTTDLKAELDSINPEVLDSDFENLKKATATLSLN